MAGRAHVVESGPGQAELGGGALLVGGVLILSSILFPRAEDPADSAAVVALLLDNLTLTRVVLLAVPIGLWALTAGMAVITLQMADTPAAWVGRLGFHVLIGGSAVITVQFAIGMAAVSVGDQAAGATLWTAATMVRSFGMMVFWVGLVVVAIAMLIGQAFPRWAGVVLLVAGAAMSVVTFVTLAAGSSSLTSALSGGLAAVTALWAIVVGVRTLRASRMATRPSP